MTNYNACKILGEKNVSKTNEIVPEMLIIVQYHQTRKTSWSINVQKKKCYIDIPFQCKTSFFSFPAETEVFPPYLVVKSQWTCTLAIKLYSPIVGRKQSTREHYENTNPFTIRWFQLSVSEIGIYCPGIIWSAEVKKVENAWGQEPCTVKRVFEIQINCGMVVLLDVKPRTKHFNVTIFNVPFASSSEPS